MTHRIRARVSSNIAVGLLVCLVLGSVGCATTHRGASVKPSGFLGDYTQLQQGADDEAQLLYVNPQADLAAYDKVIIDPVTIWCGEGSALSGASKDEMQKLADYLHAALTGALQQDYSVVDQAGPGVLRVRVAITEARQSEVVTEIASLGTTGVNGSSLRQGPTMSARTRVLAGEAAVEGEIVDSVSGLRLMAAVDRRAGSSVQSNRGPWNDILDAYDFWAKRLRQRLAEPRAQ